MTFINWAGTQTCRPAAVHRPTSEDELVAVVADAAAAEEKVKAVGSGHSFTGAALTEGHQVVLDRYAEVIDADPDTGRVTVQAGITLAHLSEALDHLGLALENMGDIGYQTVSGAIATATHGTGPRIGNLATQVKALRLVSGAGEAVDCDAANNAALFSAARVGVGVLGLVSTVTLRCVPAFRLHAVEAPMRLDAVLEALDDHVDGHDHFEFFWVPHTGWALTKANDRTEEAARPRPGWATWRDEVLLANLAFGAICRVGRRWPNLVPRLATALPSSGRVEYVERSDRVFTSPRWVRFTEMEYAIPRSAAGDAVREVRAMVERLGLLVSFPVEVRFVAADDIALSPSSGRDTCYIAVHMYQGVDNREYFAAVESIMDDFGGRPHWGKLHTQTAATLAPRYPDWDRFQAARRQIDPTATFANDHTDTVLGTR